MLRSCWVWGAVLLALAIGTPNLLFQAWHDWPQLAMGHALAENHAPETRVLMWPFLLLMLGPPLVPVWAAGLAGLIRRPEWRPVRFLAPAFLVLLVLVFALGAQLYYPFGFLAAMFAIGCVPTAEWMQRSPAKRGIVVVAVSLNAAVSLVLGLPVVPVTVLGATPVPAVNQVARDSVGWPTHVRQIAAAGRRLSPRERRRTVIVTSNYGEAGAVDMYGGGFGLPPAYSGHNELYYKARPPAGTTVAIVVGGQLPAARPHFRSCRTVGRLDNLLDVDNEEQGQPIAFCRGPMATSTVVFIGGGSRQGRA